MNGLSAVRSNVAGIRERAVRSTRAAEAVAELGSLGDLAHAMWPFTKKTKTPDRLPIDGPWSVGQGEHGGKILIVRSNTGYKEFGSIAGYEHQVGIAVPLRAPEPTGLPSPAEDAELGPIEDAISQSLEAQAESLLVAIITTSGMREFVFYTRAPESVKQRFEQLRSSITSHEIQLMIQPDKDWGVYGQVA